MLAKGIHQVISFSPIHTGPPAQPARPPGAQGATRRDFWISRAFWAAAARRPQGGGSTAPASRGRIPLEGGTPSYPLCREVGCETRTWHAGGRGERPSLLKVNANAVSCSDLHCFGTKENNTFLLAKKILLLVQRVGRNTEKFDTSFSSKNGLLFFSLNSCGGQASFAVPFLRLPPFKCGLWIGAKIGVSSSFLPWELDSATAHVVHFLGAYRQANAAAAAKLL